MLRTLLLPLMGLLLTSPAWGQPSVKDLVDFNRLQALAMYQAEPMGLDWKVGEEADYKIKMSITEGTKHSFVREKVPEGYWVQQDIDLGFLGKNKIEILFDKQSGEILQLKVNGEKKDPPDPSNFEVVEMEETNVSVPAGEFNCVYVKIRNKEKDQTSEAWVNRDKIPIGGTLKQKSPSQMGEVVSVLTAYTDK